MKSFLFIKVFVVFSLISFFISYSMADENSEYSEKARTRQYLGGPDESDLKVQSQLVKIQKSKNETTLENAEEGF